MLEVLAVAAVACMIALVKLGRPASIETWEIALISGLFVAILVAFVSRSPLGWSLIVSYIRRRREASRHRKPVGTVSQGLELKKLHKNGE